ncbi:MAG: hypothetical protein K8H86_05940 [Ignavibacteriaceae bacterium]|nr:hypothetical protein [Ignavibacteriaceae bacterium]
MINKNNFLFLFVFLFFSAPFINGQMHYLDDYEGIPIVAVYTNVDARDMSSLNFQRLRELGAVGISTRIHDNNEYNLIINNGLRVIPINIWGTGLPSQELVSYYSDAMYTKWEAEGHMGDTLHKGVVELKYTDEIGELFYDANDNCRGIATKNSTPGKLIFGPAYAQHIKYQVMKIDSAGYVPYTTTFRLKIKKINPSLDVDLDAHVCTIRVVASNPKVPTITYKDIQTRTLTVRDFIEGTPTGWDNWRKKIFEYNLKELENKIEESLRGIYPGQVDDPNKFDSMWMQFFVDWTGLDNVKLYVDYVEVKDGKGEEIKNQTTVKEQVAGLVTMYNNPTNVLGWMGLNEPGSIDNFEPIRIVDSLIQAASGGILRYYATFTSGWKGLVGYNQPDEIPSNGYALTSLEFIRRAQLNYISYNLYNYDFPYIPDPKWPTYYKDNIDDYIVRNLKPLLANNIPFAYSTQSGKFYIRDTNCVNQFPNFHNPSSAQMMYHINLGLLFGMKELTMDPFFTLMSTECPDSIYREGLVDAKTNTLTSLGITWKEKVAPRLSGLMGKTLKRIIPIKQFNNLNLIQAPTVNFSFVNKVGAINYDNTISYFLDLGFFRDSVLADRYYSLAINRHYSTLNEIQYTFQNPNSFYKNYRLKNLIDSTSTDINLTSNFEYSTTIEKGDAHFIRLTPAVKYGGSVLGDETILAVTTLTEEDLVVKNGATLTINARYDAYKSITVKSGGKINCGTNSNSMIVFHGDAKLIMEGNAELSGTPAQKLVIDFLATDYGRTIYVKHNASAKIHNCIIKNAYAGVSIDNDKSKLTDKK